MIGDHQVPVTLFFLEIKIFLVLYLHTVASQALVQRFSFSSIFVPDFWYEMHDVARGNRVDVYSL